MKKVNYTLNQKITLVAVKRNKRKQKQQKQLTLKMMLIMMQIPHFFKKVNKKMIKLI